MFCCELCWKQFKTKSSFLFHEMTHRGPVHTDERPHSCDVCGKTFTKKSLLKRHSQTHIDRRRYECNQCDKKYSRKYTLEQHMRVHTREKPFPCNQCEKKYMIKDSLNAHIRHVHEHVEKEQTVSCHICDRGFTKNSYLTNHMIRVHAELIESIFVCDVCGENIPDKEKDFQAHMLSHKIKSVFKCNVCMLHFATEQALTSHKQNHNFSKDRFRAILPKVNTNQLHEKQRNACDEKCIKRSVETGTVCEKPSSFLDKKTNNSNLTSKEIHTAENNERTVFCRSFGKNNLRKQSVPMKPLNQGNTLSCRLCDREFPNPASCALDVDLDAGIVLCEQCKDLCVPCSFCQKQVQFSCLMSHMKNHLGGLTVVNIVARQTVNPQGSNSTQ